MGCSSNPNQRKPVAPVEVQEVVISSPVSCIDGSKVPKKPKYMLIKKTDNNVDKMIALKYNNNLFQKMTTADQIYLKRDKKALKNFQSFQTQWD